MLTLWRHPLFRGLTIPLWSYFSLHLVALAKASRRSLRCAAALASALSNNPVPVKSVFFGEIGLSGEVRAVSQTELRLKEATKLGFENAYCGKKAKGGHEGDISLSSLNYLIEMMDIFRNPHHSKVKRI